MSNQTDQHGMQPILTAKHTRGARLLRKFVSDTHGNIAMMFILMSSLLFLFVGGSVDYARYNSVRADMLASLDAASLAIARMEELHPNMTDPQLITYGEKFFAENAQKEGLILKPSKTPYSTISEIVAFDLTSDTTKVKACIDGTIKTALLSVVKIDYLDVKQCVGITKFGAGRIELALVLDVTGSMRWNDDNGVKKITSLKNAVTAMLDVMFDTETQSDNLKVGVIPFNTHVNAGGAALAPGRIHGVISTQILSITALVSFMLMKMATST
ncbi:MAG: pilus assembly protein [Alphaproteobacteria bacterium]|nr:pilus assembly protein [Alphaproteobacteria bacterium]